jgi:hypothetical protein
MMPLIVVMLAPAPCPISSWPLRSVTPLTYAPEPV